MLVELGATPEQFLECAKKGLAHPEDKVHFEYLISCDNFIYFKGLMIRRNLELEDEALKIMIEKDKFTGTKSKLFVNVVLEESVKLKGKREEIEMECAIQMSLALEQEKKRVLMSEEEELIVNTCLIYLECS